MLLDTPDGMFLTGLMFIYVISGALSRANEMTPETSSQPGAMLISTKKKRLLEERAHVRTYPEISRLARAHTHTHMSRASSPGKFEEIARRSNEVFPLR